MQYPKFIERLGAQAQWDAIPEHMHGGIQRYVESGIPPGSFLTAVLENDLMGAVGRADEVNRHRLFDYASLMHNGMPSACFGSAEHVAEWISIGGLNGITEIHAA